MPSSPGSPWSSSRAAPSRRRSRAASSPWTREPEPPTKVFPGTMAVLEPICLKALAKDPDKRYQRASEFADAIEAALGPERPSQRLPAAPRPDDAKPGKGETSKGLFGRLFGG